MAILTRFDVQGMSTEKYEEVLRKLEAAGAGAPPGRLHHFSYGSSDNLQVVDVYDSPESMQAFGQTLVPILQEMGIQAKPEVQGVYKTIEGR